MPTSTLTSINKIIDPRNVYPGNVLPAAEAGQRYLITEDLTKTGYSNWNIDANANDIIEYDGTKWSVSFDASNVSDVKYVTNTNTKEKNYLTHAENLILYKLFSEKTVNKKLLERDALNIKQDLNTSSIESHLNRIRKKLKKINSDFSVSSKNNNVFLEIINLDK